MLKAIIYKEWLKTRNVFFIGLLLSVCIAGFDILSMNRVATMKGVEHIWQIMLMKDNMFVNHLAFVPIAVGLGISLAQMLPEMAQKRLKLTLHLPYSQNKMILAMLAVGLVEILVVSAITILMVVCYDSAILVPELVTRVVLTMAPWFVGGVATYLVTAAVCIESCLRQRIAISLLGIGIVLWFYVGDAPEAYNAVLLPLMVMALLCSLIVYRSVYRFKEGR